MDDFEGLNNSVEVTTYMVKTARELAIETESEDATGLLQTHHKTLMDEELLFTG